MFLNLYCFAKMWNTQNQIWNIHSYLWNVIQNEQSFCVGVIRRKRSRKPIMKGLFFFMLSQEALEKRRAYQREYRKKNAERCKAYNREYLAEYRKKNPEKIAEYNRKWRKKNPDKVKANNERYWERLANKDIEALKRAIETE